MIKWKVLQCEGCLRHEVTVKKRRRADGSWSGWSVLHCQCLLYGVDGHGEFVKWVYGMALLITL